MTPPVALYTIPNLAKAMGVSRWTVARWVKRWEVETIQASPKGKHLITLDALVEALPHHFGPIIAKLSEPE